MSFLPKGFQKAYVPFVGRTDAPVAGALEPNARQLFLCLRREPILSVYGPHASTKLGSSRRSPLMNHNARTSPPCGWILLIGLVVLLFAGEPARQEAATGVTAVAGTLQKSTDPLVELNSRFRAAYAQARKELLAKQGPVIIADGDNVILLRRGQRTEVKVTTMADIVKPIGHTPVAIHALLASTGEAELSKERLTDLRFIRELIEPAAKSLAGRGLPQDIYQLQTQILDESAKFLDGVLANKKVKSEELLTFTRKLGPLLLTSTAYAASTQLDEMHKQVMTWKAGMTAAEWRQLRVLIPGSSAPRKDNLRTQYFVRLLGEKAEDERIMYAEALFDESRALNLLGSYQLDTVIGSDFFKDPGSMHRDLLADGAAAHLKQMKFDQAK